MKIGHWMRKEPSGLAYTTLELVQAEQLFPALSVDYTFDLSAGNAEH